MQLLHYSQQMTVDDNHLSILFEIKSYGNSKHTGLACSDEAAAPLCLFWVDLALIAMTLAV